MQTIETINPATGNKLAEYQLISDSTLEQKLVLADGAYQTWKKINLDDRIKLMHNVAELLRKNVQHYSHIITREMGKPCIQATAEVEKCARLCDYYIENAPEILNDNEIKTEYSRSYVSYLPMGVIFSIMPWNFPFWQVFRFAVPNLIAGNTAVLKHSPNTTGTAQLIEDIFTEAGFPRGVFQNLIISNEQASNVIADRKIRGVTFTGSTATGSIVAQQAAKNLKKTVLELGGSDAYIVLKDADLSKTVDLCVTGRMINSGQSCIAAKRFIVAEDIADEFTSRFVEKMKTYTIGDPLSCSINFGPIARLDLRDQIANQVERSIAQGAKLAIGGSIPERNGYFYDATVLTDTRPGMACFDEEIFGPVASISVFKNEEEAVELANVSEFGLASAIFTSDVEKGEYIAKNFIEAGSCFVNDFAKSDPRLPFGGIKNSGYGRELSLIGMHEFLNIKTVCVK